jgi:2-oxoisovalerate dehydrogenase E2 component (dihydrolipoyl transacylase)
MQYSHSAKSLAVVPFKLADIGEGIAEVELMQWFVKEGDIVKSFDRLCEVQSDKATVEITSRYGGTVVAVHHKEGDIVNVGSALVDIETGAAAPASASAPTAVSASTSIPQPVSDNSPTPTPISTGEEGSNNKKVLTTPAVRKMAKENAVDLSTVSGTGPKGRVLKEDMMRHVHAMKNCANAANPISASSSSSSSSASVNSRAGDVVVPIRGIQRLMVKSMTAAGQVRLLESNMGCVM